MFGYFHEEEKIKCDNTFMHIDTHTIQTVPKDTFVWAFMSKHMHIAHTVTPCCTTTKRMCTHFEWMDLLELHNFK